MRRITENKLLRLINEEIQNILQENAGAAVSMQAHQQLAARLARLERAAVAAGWNLKAPSSNEGSKAWKEVEAQLDRENREKMERGQLSPEKARYHRNLQKKIDKKKLDPRFDPDLYR